MCFFPQVRSPLTFQGPLVVEDEWEGLRLVRVGKSGRKEIQCLKGCS